MYKLITGVIMAFVLFILTAPFIWDFSPSYNAQAVGLGERFFHCDTLKVTTVANDCTWTDPWIEATIYTDTVNVDLKLGAPDTGSWSERRGFYLPQGMAFSIGPTPKLQKLTVTARTGAGRLYIIGYKDERQY